MNKSTDAVGSGRPVPCKEGMVNKKSTGGLRAEWKRKYLVLSQDELTYYPSLNVSSHVYIMYIIIYIYLLVLWSSCVATKV